MKSIKIEIGKNLTETLLILITCIAFCIVVKFIDVKKTATIERIEKRLEQIENHTGIKTNQEYTITD